MPVFRAYRLQLPHWRLEGSCYFVTFRVHWSQPELGFEERTLVEKSVLFGDGKRHHIDAHVVMNDHVHVLVRPLAGELETLVHSWKSFSANRLQRLFGRRGAVWQREYFDRVVRDEAEWLEKMAYIAGNPVKRWPGVVDYPWVFPRI